MNISFRSCLCLIHRWRSINHWSLFHPFEKKTVFPHLKWLRGVGGSWCAVGCITAARLKFTVTINMSPVSVCVFMFIIKPWTIKPVAEVSPRRHTSPDWEPQTIDLFRSIHSSHIAFCPHLFQQFIHESPLSHCHWVGGWGADLHPSASGL